MAETPLWERMRALASEPRGQFRADELRTKADELEQKATGYYQDDPPTVTPQSFLGAYARARLCWCEITGESLV